MEVVTFALDVIYKAGPTGCLVLFAWLFMTGRIVTAGEMRRAGEGHEREKQQIRDERDHARKESGEWKFMAMRGTELAQYLGEKAATPS